MAAAQLHAILDFKKFEIFTIINLEENCHCHISTASLLEFCREVDLLMECNTDLVNQ